MATVFQRPDCPRWRCSIGSGKGRVTFALPMEKGAPRHAAQAMADAAAAALAIVRRPPDAVVPRELARAKAALAAMGLKLPAPDQASPQAERLARETSLEDAFHAHPSTIREQAASPKEYKRHLRDLREFAAWAGIATIGQLTAAKAAGWAQEMVRRGWRPATRRHALLALSRAAAQCPAAGFPNPLAGARIDRTRAGERRNPRAYSLDQMRQAISEGPPARAAFVALSALCALRPSEALRLDCGDIEGAWLRIGLDKDGQPEPGQAKNQASYRRVPLPPQVAALLAPLAKGQKPSAPLFRVAKGRWAGRRSADVRAVCPSWEGLTAKAWRKTFVLACREAAVPDHVRERMLGHSGETITARHYDQGAADAELQEAANRLGRLLSAPVFAPVFSQEIDFAI